MRVSSVVDTPHAVLAGDQAGGGEVFEGLLDGALGVEPDFGDEVARVDQAVALSDGRHHCEPVSLPEHDPREFLELSGDRPYDTPDMLLHDLRYRIRVTDIL